MFTAQYWMSTVAHDSKLILAMDLGGSKLALQLRAGIDAVHESRIALTGDAAADLYGICEHIANLRARLGRRIAAVGLAAAPQVDANGAIACWPSRPDWVGLPLVTNVAAAAQAPVAVLDDGCAAALADSAALASGELVHFVIGTGVGGGIVLGGKLYSAVGRATELGHMIVQADGRACVCGRRGCLQAYASCAALSASLDTNASFEEFVGAYASGRVECRRALERAAAMMAVAMVTLTEILGPISFSIGGGAVAALKDYLPRISAALDPLLRPGMSKPSVVTSPLGTHGPLTGAMLAAGQMIGLQPQDLIASQSTTKSRYLV